MTTHTRFERFGKALGEFIAHRPALTLALSLGVCVIAASGLLRAQFSTDYRIFFSKEDPGLASFQRLETVFTKTDNVLFVVSVEQGSVFEPEAMAAIDELSQAGWTLPYASRSSICRMASRPSARA